MTRIRLPMLATHMHSTDYAVARLP